MNLDSLLNSEFEIPYLGVFSKIEIMGFIIGVLILVIILYLVISKKRKNYLAEIQLAAKPYSTILEKDEEFISQCYQKLYHGDKIGAIEMITEAIKIKPENEDSYVIRGKLKLQTKDYYGAISDFTKALTLNPDLGSAYYNRAKAEFEIGDNINAESDFVSATKFGFSAENEPQHFTKLTSNN